MSTRAGRQVFDLITNLIHNEAYGNEKHDAHSREQRRRQRNPYQRKKLQRDTLNVI